jgi:inner membrane protein
MASIGHVAVGLAAGRAAGGTRGEMGRCMALFTALSLLPDADVVAFRLGIPYHAPFGHRGASHSLVFALAAGMLGALILRRYGWRFSVALLAAGGVVASHGLLDAMTDGGLGIALFWPFSTERFFAPWRPLPVAPIGARLVSARGLRVMLIELVQFMPLFVYALWPRSWRGRG